MVIINCMLIISFNLLIWFLFCCFGLMLCGDMLPSVWIRAIMVNVPAVSPLTKMDFMIDYLTQRDDIDPTRIGITGESLGGMHAWFAAFADTRYAVAAPIIGVQGFRWAIENDKWQAQVNNIKVLFEDNEEVYEQFKEVKWMEWCEDVMIDEIKTLRCLQRLQTTSADLPKDKVLSKIQNYLQLLGRRIDQIVLEHEDELYGQDRMTILLWNYVSTFSNLSGERLHQIYSKLRTYQL
ncbi:hypothetical protein REPUB_Repub01dG0072000 [Reevesia pubescens]